MYMYIVYICWQNNQFTKLSHELWYLFWHWGQIIPKRKKEHPQKLKFNPSDLSNSSFIPSYVEKSFKKTLRNNFTIYHSWSKYWTKNFVFSFHEQLLLVTLNLIEVFSTEFLELVLSLSNDKNTFWGLIYPQNTHYLDVAT